MRLKKKTRPAPPVSDELLVWIARHRGAIQEIADQARPAVTGAFVSMVARGKKKSRNGQIERMLKAKGAPI